MQRLQLVSIYQLVLFLSLFPLLSNGQDVTLTVNTIDDKDDGQCSDQHCSYREALLAANEAKEDILINFAIPGSDKEQRIILESPLPKLSHYGTLTIDGLSQPEGQIIIDGDGRIDFGLYLRDVNTVTVTGLQFMHCTAAGIYATENAVSLLISTNIFINNRYGTVIESPNTVFRKNIFDSNEASGILLTGPGAALVGKQGNSNDDNSFLNHGVAGIISETSNPALTVFGNRFSCNATAGIKNLSKDVPPPIIQKASNSFVAGNALSNALVQVYLFDPSQNCKQDNNCQGQIFLGTTLANSSGNWTLEAANFETSLSSDYLLTATQTAKIGDALYRYTSEFANCFSFCTTYNIQLTSDRPDCPGDPFLITPLLSSDGGDPAPLSFSWSGPGGFSSNDSEIKADQEGTYTLVATNSCNNIKTSITIIAAETPPANVVASSNSPVCAGSTLQLSASTADLVYEWSGPLNFQANTQNPIVASQATSLQSGIYFLQTRTLKYGCTGPTASVEVQVVDRPQLQGATLATCAPGLDVPTAIFNLSSLDNQVSNGNSNVVISWFDSPALSSPITAPATYSSGTGTVYATGTNAAGCSAEAVAIALNVLPAVGISLNIQQDIDCTNPSSGQLLATVQGGTSPYQFVWSDPELKEDNPSGLSAGFYQLTIVDDNNCTANTSIQLLAPPGPSLNCSVLQNSSFVGLNDGAAEIGINAGTAPYYLNIPNLQDTSFIVNAPTTLKLNNLAPGDYVVDLKDATDCRQSCQLTIAAVDCTDFTLDVTTQPTDCPDVANGRIEIIAQAAQQPLSYDWAKDEYDGEAVINNLEVGTYAVTVSDAKGCQVDTSLRMAALHPAPELTLKSIPELCPGVCFDLPLNFSGTAPFQLEYLLFSGQDTLPQQAIFNDNTGYLTICVPDTNPSIESVYLRWVNLRDAYCTTILDRSISVPVTPPVLGTSATILHTCALDETATTGLFDLSVLEDALRLGNSTLALLWFTDASLNTPITTPANYQSPGGSVFVQGTTPTGCTSNLVEIALEVLPALKTVLTIEQAITCTAAEGGQLLAETSNGTAPFNYTWSVAGLIGKQVTGLSSGTYALTVTDAYGCQGADSISLLPPAAVLLDCTASQNISRVNANDGAAQISVDGGQPPFLLSVTTPQDTSIILNEPGVLTLNQLAPGIYNVTAIDAYGCSQSASFEIMDIDCTTLGFSQSTRPATCPEAADGWIRIQADGGQAPFHYQWSDSLPNQSFVDQLPAGNYALTVTDSLGCQATADLTLATSFPRPELIPGAAPTLCTGACGTIPLQLNGTAPFLLDYQLIAGSDTIWQQKSFNQATGTIELCTANFPPGNTAIIIEWLALRDANCSTSLEQSLRIPLVPVALGQLDTLLCRGDSLEINGSIYDYHRPRGTELFPGAAQNGCDSLVQIQVFFLDPPQVTGLQTICDPSQNTFTTRFDLLGLTPFTLNGLEGLMFGNYFVSNPVAASGSYTLSIQDALGCSSRISIEAPDCSRAANCTVQAATLLDFPENLCQYDTLQLVTSGNGQLDETQRQTFVIHDGTADQLGTILLSDTEGRFTFTPPLAINTTYFTAVIAGRDNGFGRPDFDDPCLDVQLGGPVSFANAPRRPLFIQGQDSLCAGQDLVLSTEYFNTPPLTYHWLTPNGDTLQSETNSLTIPHVASEDAGAYGVFIQAGSCVSPVFTPHQLFVGDFPFLYAGDDQEICGPNQGSLLADPISFGSGQWSTPGSANIAEPADPFSTVSDLELGLNPFIWSVSANGCTQTDTVFLRYFPAPTLADDAFMLEPGLSRITLDAFANDQLAGLLLDTATVQVVSPPESGMVQYLAADQVFEYTAGTSNLETIAFTYSVCSPACLEACDTAVVMIQLPDILLEVPDALLRGEAGQGLQIGNLEAFPRNEVVITNRWGVVVYRQKNYANDNPWKGTHNGADLPQGTYYLYLKVADRRSVVARAIHLIVR